MEHYRIVYSICLERKLADVYFLIQYDCFRSYSEKEMEQAVVEVLRECKGKRLILSPSAGPYEEVISPQMQKNYEVFIRTACGNCG